MTFKCPDKYRVQLPGYPAGDERNGCFIVPLKHQQVLRIIASLTGQQAAPQGGYGAHQGGQQRTQQQPQGQSQGQNYGAPAAGGFDDFDDEIPFD